MDTHFLTMLTPFLKYAGADAVAPDAALRDLGLDSMRAVELLFALEDGYDIVFPDELLTDATFATAGSLWAAIESLLLTAEASR